ncbi:MAG: YggT family protein [Pseudomonadota bacterium]
MIFGLVANLFDAIAAILDIVLTFFMWIIIARSVLSWVSPDPFNPIVRFIYNITEPALYWIRRRLPLLYGGIDLSPMIIILVIIFLQRFVVQSLRMFGP